MKAGIAFGARGHAYSLARYLNRQSGLHRLYTYFPSRFIDEDLRPRTRSFPYFFLARTALSRLKIRLGEGLIDRAANRAFSRWVAARMEPMDIFMAMSGLGLYARRAAKQAGAFTVCDRGSTHIRYQDELLAEEFDRWGATYRRIPAAQIAEEEAEYAEADLVVAQSTFAFRSFLDRGHPADRLTWVSPGVDTGTFFPAKKRDDVFRILFLGQIGLRKGFGYLLEAAASFLNAKTEIVLAGTIMPEAAPLLRRFEGSFRYAGRPAGKADVRELFTQSSVFVLPTVEDGFGLVLNEAMACGIPVIASANSGGPDVIQEGRQGFVIPARSAEALAEKIAFLQARPGLAADMGREALACAAANTWDVYGSRIADLYRARRAARRTATSG